MLASLESRLQKARVLTLVFNTATRRQPIIVVATMHACMYMYACTRLAMAWQFIRNNIIIVHVCSHTGTCSYSVQQYMHEQSHHVMCMYVVSIVLQ